MNALVTGGAGFIGSRLAEGLLAHGHIVRVFDNLMFGRKEAVPDGVELMVGDLRVAGDIDEACADIDVVFHHAAVKSVPRSIDEPVLVHECNATGTLNLLIAAANAGVRRLIYASSSSIYGGVGEGRSHEDMAPHPRSPYAASKLAGENYCRTWSAIGALSTVCLRYFNVFGPGQPHDSKYAAVFPAFIEALTSGRPPVIHWDGEQSRDFTYIDDVVAANV
ncbi:MAG: NAD-dependent epimerase/dehydratase family protein, partial [Actinomycetota bacterium]